MTESRTDHDLYRSLMATLKPVGQEHVLRFWDRLTASQRQRLAAQVQDQDWETLAELVQSHVLQRPETALPADLRPAPYYPIAPRTEAEQRLYSEARARGRELLETGRIAGFTVAGGQGTRLGYDGPKGTFPIGPLSGKSLFQCFAESILRAEERYQTRIPWYLMTSLVNDQPTRVFFEENAYFGLDPEHVCFFAQGVLPAFGYDGRVLLDTQDSLSLSPNGHGGSLVALRDSGALADMRARGILHVSYWQVDNPLVQMFDPLFLGLHDLLASDMSSRGLGKTGPLEKLGNFCLYPDDSLNVVEYSDMPDDLARQTEADGGLRFRIGSPAIHVIRQDFVERLTAGRLSLPMHRADKKVSHVTADGGRVEPETPNAVKLEMFVFDALPLAHNPIVVEAAREDHFGPVKNAAGVDSVESSQTLLLERGARWLRSAGVRCPAGVELSPRRFLDQDDVREQAPQLPDIEPGEKRLVE